LRNNRKVCVTDRLFRPAIHNFSLTVEKENIGGGVKSVTVEKDKYWGRG
jgi:hypothetical protein